MEAEGRGKRNKKKVTNQLDFITFCIEMYADAKNLTGQAVIQMFDQFGVLTYLSDNYEVLHTQGLGYIIPLLDEYIQAQEKN
jgi:hypothetical protein